MVTHGDALSHERATRSDNTPSGVPAAAAALALAGGLPWFLVRRLGAAPSSVVAGAASWALGVAIKRSLSEHVRRRLRSRHTTAAVALGGLSAAAELGASQAWLGRRPRPTPDLLAFGAGAAAGEAVALIVFGAFGDAPSEQRVERWVQEAGRSFLVRHALFAERLSATIGHVSSRTLLALGLRRRELTASILPVALFAFVDGVATYGHDVGWDWIDPATLRRFHLFLAVVDGIELAHLARAVRDQPSTNCGMRPPCRPGVNVGRPQLPPTARSCHVLLLSRGSSGLPPLEPPATVMSSSLRVR